MRGLWGMQRQLQRSCYHRLCDTPGKLSENGADVLILGLMRHSHRPT